MDQEYVQNICFGECEDLLDTTFLFKACTHQQKQEHNEKNGKYHIRGMDRTTLCLFCGAKEGLA